MAVNPQTHQLLGMADAAKDRMHSKLSILRDLELYRRAHDYSFQVGAIKFCEAYNSHNLAVDDELRETFPTLSHSTIEKWRLKLKAKGVTSLGGEYGKRKGQTLIDAQPELRDHIVAFLVQFPHTTATRVMDFLQARYRDSSMKLPAQRTLQDWVDCWKSKNAQTFMAITNPDQWKNKYKAAFGSSDENIVALNQLWELDGTPADVMLADGRYAVTGAIDVYSRRITLLVTKTARSQANAQLLRKKILAEGKPQCVKTDQGKDYVSHEFTAFIAATDIEHATSNKFSPWEKPHIERAFRTFSHDIVELLPGYIGHNVADAQAIRAKQSFADRLFEKNAVVTINKTAEEFQQFCDDWCDKRYAHHAHEGLNGKTPFQVAAEWREPIERIDDERALDLLLLEIPGSKGIRVVQKKGIRLPDGWFIAPELEAHIGMQVHCRYVDAGRVVCYSVDPWSFICIAVEPELAGFSRKEIAAKTREIQKHRVQEARSALKAIERTVNAKDAAAEIMRDDAVSSGRLAYFPKRGENITTPALQAAAQVREALDAPVDDSSTLISSEEFSRLRADVDKHKQAQLTPVFDSPIARAYWIANESYKRDLSGEETSYLENFAKLHPRDAAEMDAMMRKRHGLGDASKEA